MISDFSIKVWLSKRLVTATLVVSITVWYAIQLLTLQRFGVETAVWWFYFTPGEFGPGFAVTPGIVFSPISHDMSKLMHLGSNVVALVIVGSFADSYIKRQTYLSVLLGVGFLGILVSNVLAVYFQTPWSLAGASAGLLSLHAFVSLQKRHLLTEFTPFRSMATVEWLIVATGLMMIPTVPIYELTVSGNTGHALGPVLGTFAFFIYSETSRDPGRCIIRG